MLLDENKTQDEQKEVSAEAETVEVVEEKSVVEPVVEIPKTEEIIVEEKPILAEPKLEEEIVVENIESEVSESPEVVEVKSEQSEQVEKPVLDNIEKVEPTQPIGQPKKVEQVQTESVPVAPKSQPTPPQTPSKPEVRTETKTVEKIVYKTDPNIVTNLLNKARATIQERKRKKLDKIMTLFETKPQIRSMDVQKLLFAKKRTVTNYLDQLESEQKIIQVGKTGKGALYIRKP